MMTDPILAQFELDPEFVDAIGRLGPVFFVILIMGMVVYLYARVDAARRRGLDQQREREQAVQQRIQEAREDERKQLQAELKTLWERVLKDAQAREDKLTAQWSQREQRYETRIQTLEAENDVRDTQMLGLQVELADQMAAMERAKKEYITCKDDIMNLTAQRDKALAERNAAHAERDEAIEERDGLKERVTNLEKMMQTVQHELRVVTDERETMKQENKALKAEVDSLQRQLTSIGHSRIDPDANETKE